MAHRGWSFRATLTAWYVAILALLLLVFFVQFYLLAAGTMDGVLQRSLEQDARTLEWAVGQRLEQEFARAEAGKIPFFMIEYPDGRSLVSESWMTGGLATLPTSQPHTHRDWQSPAGDTFRLLAIEMGEGGRLIVARDTNEIRVTRQAILLSFAIGLPSILLFAVLGGWLLAGRALRPVQEMVRRAREITAERLNARLPVGNSGDEFSQLAVVFNETLARLEASFTQLQQFTSDASHQLRTPLAAMRATGESAITNAASPEELRDAIGSMLEEADRLLALVEGLLALTRAEGGQITLKREKIDLADLATECVETLRVLAEEKSIALRVDLKDGLISCVDRTLFSQALLNIIDNAIKYAPPGGEVSVLGFVDPTDGAVVLEIRDNGPGIEESQHERIFQRFYRTPSAAGSRVPGTGLGLALARWAVQANGGTIRAANAPEVGSIFTIRFPSAERRESRLPDGA